MKKSRKKKLKYKNILVLFVIIICIIVIPKILSNNKETELKMINIVNKNYDEIIEIIEDYNIEINLTYEYNDEIKDLGFVDFIIKPVKKEELLNKIKQYAKKDN